MTNPQTPDNQPQPPENRRRWLPLVRPEERKKLGIALGVTLLAGGAGGAAWLWYFVTNDLAPIAQREISKTLKRPVLLGPVKGFSLTGIRFGPSSLPATPTDPDRATTEAVKVGFDIIQLLATRTLSLDVTFVNADAYIEQDEKGQWITVPKIETQEPGWLKVELDSLGVENAKVALVPYEVSENSPSQLPTPDSSPPIALRSVNGAIRFREEYKRMLYEVSGSTTAVPAPTPVPAPSPGNAPPPVPSPAPVPAPPNSSFRIQGSSTLPDIRTTDLSVQARDFPAIAFNRLLKRTVKVPVTLYDGLLDANVQMQFRPQQFPEFNGTAGLKAVTAKIEPLPKLLTQTNGLLIFQPGQKVVLSNVTTIYGQVPAFADGLVALRDNSNLNIQVQRVNAKQALETLDVKVPVALAGDVQASLKATGPITQPVVSGTVSSLDNNKGAPLQVERFNLANFGAGIVFARGNLTLDYVRAVPAVGGQVTATGNVKLGSQDSPPLVALEFRASQLPGEAIARLFNISPGFKLGALAATGSIVGPANNLQTTVSWQAPEAAYPASGTAIVRGALETAVFRDTTVKIADGTVLASGTLADEVFSLDLEPKNLSLNQLAAIVNQEFLEDSENKIPQLNQPGQIVTGNIRVSGNTNAIRADTVAASGLAIASVAGGTASITGALRNGRWNLAIDPSGMELAKLAQLAQSLSPNTSLPLSPAEISRLPVSLANAYITLSGTTNNLTAEAINANANARLIAAGGSANIAARLEGGNWQATVAGENVDVTRFAPGLTSDVPISPVSGEITLAGTTADFSPNALRAGDGRLSVGVAGGTLAVEDIRLSEGRWQAVADISQVDLTPFLKNAAPDVAEELGRFSGSFVVAGNTEALTRDRSLAEGIAPLLESISLSGSGALSVAGGVANLTEITAQQGRWRTAIAAEQVAVIPLVEDNLKGVSKNLPLSELGAFTGNITARGDFKSLFPPAQNRRQQGMESVLASIGVNLAGDVRVAGGNAGVTGTLSDGTFTARIAADAIAVTPFLERNIPPSAAAIPLSELGRFSGTVDIAGNVRRLDLDEIRLMGSGSLTAAGGFADVRGRLAAGEWVVDVAASDIPVSPFLPVQPAIAREFGRLTGNFAVSGTTESFELASIAVTGAATLGVAGGTVSASSVQVQGKRWQGAIAARDVQIGRLSDQLRGEFSGNLNLSGSLDALTPANVRARGDVFLSQGVSIVKKPLNAAIAWDGERLQINRATAPGLNVNGFISVDTRNLAAIQLTGVDLNVRARSYDLRDLPLEQLPDAILPRGEADFTGRIQGTPSAPRIAGDVQLRDFRLNQVAFDPVLTGNVAIATGEKVQVQLQGEQDEIQINAAFSPSPPLSLPTSLSFLLRRGEAIARGSGDNRGLQVALEQFPLTALNLTAPPIAGPGPIAGLVSGELNLAYGNVLQCRDVACALSTVQGSGTVAIAQPRVGVINANSFEGQIVLANGVAELQNGRLLKGESTYVATARVTCPWAFLPGAPVNGSSGACADPQYQARVAIESGQLQDVLTSLQIFRLQDVARGLNPPEYASGAVVAPVPLSVRGADMLAKLRRYSEIVALLEQQRQARQEASPLPDLQELQGAFNGEISVAGSLKTGVNSRFEISGEDWRWGEYGVDRVLVAGSFERGILTLLPLEVRTGDSLIAFSGTLGLLNQSGQLRVENFPVETLLGVVEKFTDVPIPVQLTGDINASATLAGNLFNPQARGEVTLVDGTLNQTPVQAARGSFSYSDSRLNFGSTVIVSGPDPIQLVGSIPYQISPFSLSPESDRLSLSVNVQNEGLALLNVLSGGRVRWVSGRGQVQARVEGTLKEPLATGIAQVEGATIEAQLLPEPLTNVTGRVLFNRDRISVEGISGQFSKGLVLVQGVLPIFAEFSPTDTDAANPLRVSLDRLAVNLKGLYRGGVNGIVTVTGTAQQPQIGGTVELRDGQILLSEAAAAGGSFLPPDASAGEAAIQPSLNDLKLILGQDVQIARPPILNFVAAGDLTINGLLDDLKPQGTIRLRRGQVNLFTTQFRLLGGYEQTATFTPESGLDPILDVRLGASVSEVTNSRLPTPAFSNEIEDAPATGLGETQTVRIQASVRGPASQLFDNLELTSSPSRTESEIVALLGGGFVNTLGRGDSTLAIANLAGSALLSPIESALINALGVTEFRLFPTTITRDGARSSTLGLGAEVGIDITRKFSASVIRVLTDATQPTQFNLRYRLDNRTLLRGSTDLSGENRATVEYEIRF